MTTDLLPLRSYQREAIDAVFSAWSGGMGCPAVVLPCGAGKTVIMSHLSQEFMASSSGRVVILVHRDELVDQTLRKLRSIAPHLKAGRVKATDDEVSADVAVCSVQTVSRDNRLARLVSARETGLILTDEIHHGISASYRKVYDAFPGARRAGVTATLARGDGVGLGDIVDDVVYTRSVLWMISRGYLCDVRGQAVTAENLDLSSVKRSGGDYQAGALGDAMTGAGMGEFTARAYRQYAAERPGIVFTPTVAAAHDVAENLNEYGLPAAVVSAGTPRDERLKVYEASRTGGIKVIVNCGVLTEGADFPWISCVVPKITQSDSLAIQMMGRALRPFPGKSDALILSIGGSGARFRTLIDLEPGAVKEVRDGETLADAVVREAEEGDAVVPAGHVSFALRNKDVDLFTSSSQSWLRTPAGVMFIPAESGEVFLWPEKEGTWTVAHAPKGAKWERLHTGCMLGTAMAWAETEADERSAFNVRRTASWKRKRASGKQVAFATTLGVVVPEKARMGEVGEMISVALAARRLDYYVGRA